jgi:predicted transcriptional regulator
MTIDGKEYKVGDLMRPAVVITENTQLKDALEALINGKSNIAVVVDADGVFVGGVSTIDIIRAVLPKYLEDNKNISHFVDNKMLCEDTQKAATKLVIDFVNKNDSTIDPDANLLEATIIASADGPGRIIVVDENKKPLGILTRTEIKHVLAAFLDITHELHDFCANNNC